MNAEVLPLKTAAETALAESFVAARDRLPGPGTLRVAAFERFQAAGLPNRRVEEWKYTDLRALASGRIRHARKRLGVAHQGAQIGVLPLLHAAVRQASGREALEGCRAQQDRSRQLALRLLPVCRQLLLGSRPDRDCGRRGHAISSWYCA